MKLRIQTLTGQSKDVEVDPQNTVLDLEVSRRVDGKVDPEGEDKVSSVRGRVGPYSECNVENEKGLQNALLDTKVSSSVQKRVLFFHSRSGQIGEVAVQNMKLKLISVTH